MKQKAPRKVKINGILYRFWKIFGACAFEICNRFYKDLFKFIPIITVNFAGATACLPCPPGYFSGNFEQIFL